MPLSRRLTPLAGFLIAAVLLIGSGLTGGGAQAQHTSNVCPPQTATVAAGGSVTINISACSPNIGFAGIGSIDGGSNPAGGPGDFEDHGTATTRISNGQWFLDYSHNGTTGIGGTDVFELTGGEGAGLDDVLFTITITPSASPITVTPGVLPTLTAGVPFSQTLTSSGGTSPYTYSLASGEFPPGISLSPTGVLSGTPTRRGAYSFSVRSTDDNDVTVDKGYTGNILNPTLALGTGSGTASRNLPFSQQLTVVGGVGPYAFQVETGTLPTGITLSNAGLLSGTTSDAAGPFPVTIRVTDSSTGPGVYFEVEAFTLNVTNNQPPTANAGPDQTVASGAGVTLNGTGSSDPENQTLTYAWSQTGGPGVALSDNAAAQPTFTAPTVAFNAAPVVLTFSLTVNDGAQSSAAADTVTITVSPAVNQPPTADAGADQTVASGAGVTLNGTGSSDPENQTLTYAWSQSAGPTVALSDDTAAQPTFTAPTVPFNAAPVLLTFDLVVNDGAQDSTIDSVTVTVSPAVNQVPTADAGADQTVASGAGVTLDGTGSTDPENQTLTYAWTQTAGTAVTLSNGAAAQPTFTAPVLPFNAADATLTFSLTVNDGVQDSPADTVTITVTAPVDVTDPTVTLAGMPASVLPGAEVQITVTFSEDVTGLALGDFLVANGTATALSGSGTSYVLTVTAGGGGTLSVSLPADQAQDVAGNGNVASNLLEAGAGAITETEEAIATYLQTRANALVGAQPDLIRLLNPTGLPQVAVSTKGFTFNLSGDYPLWASLTGSWGESGEADTRYVLGTLGAHTWLNERTILGVMLEVDEMRMEETDRTIEGTGWLIGPYVAGQVQDQPLFYEGRLLWGETRNEITQFGLPADRFDSERMLAQVKLQGAFTLGTTVLRPFVDGSYVSDRQEAYVDGLGNPIGAQRVDQTQVALGLDATWRMEQGGGVLEPLAGFSAVYSDSSGSGVATAIDPAFDGWRGKLRGGLRYTTGTTVVDLTTFFDGIGADEYEDYGLSFSFSTKF